MDARIDDATRKVILEYVDKDTKSRSNRWPGTPLASIPISWKDTLHGMIDDGEVKIVTQPSLKDPSKDAYFVTRA